MRLAIKQEKSGEGSVEFTATLESYDDIKAAAHQLFSIGAMLWPAASAAHDAEIEKEEAALSRGDRREPSDAPRAPTPPPLPRSRTGGPSRGARPNRPTGSRNFSGAFCRWRKKDSRRRKSPRGLAAR
jgi:hypothetical protein